MAKIGISARERKLFELVTLALGQLQDDEAVLTYLARSDGPDVERAESNARAIRRVSTHIHDELRAQGLIVKPRQSFETDD